MIFCSDKIIAARLHEQERRVVALLYCLQTDHMQAQCLLWFLHTWSPDWCFVSLEDLGLLPLLNHLKKSHSLVENPILHELQSAIMLRELQSFLGKYNIRVTVSLLTKTADAICLITHLACLISWKKVSFTDSLKVVRLLRPYIGMVVDNNYVAFLRLQMMTSVSNRPLITHIACTFQNNALQCVRDLSSVWTWEGYDAWEASWRLSFLQEIEDYVICELSEFEKMTVARNFSLYAFLTLEKTAERLAQLNLLTLQLLSVDLSMTVAESVLVQMTAIYLEQQVVTAASKHSVKKIPLDENSLKLFFPKHSLQTTQQTQLHFLTGECELSKNNLRRLKSCERLRREFGVFVRPSQIRLDDTPKHVMSSFPVNGSYDSKQLNSFNLLARWNTTLETQSLKHARNEFLHLTKKWSPQQYASSLNVCQTTEANEHAAELRKSKGEVPCTGNSEHKKKRQITKLLQFGVLMGVGESFARHHSILLLSSHYLTNVNSDLLTRLLTDLERNSTSRNASDILRMLRILLPSLQEMCEDARKSISVLVYLSQILNVACCCLRFLPQNELKDAIGFCSDILLILQFLVQSDLLDTALDSSSNDVSFDTSNVHFSILSRLFLPLLCEKPSDLDATVSNAVKNTDNFLPAVSQRTFDNRSLKLFDTQFHNISSLYKKQEALYDSMKFLLLRLKITSEGENHQETLNELRHHVAFIVKKLLDHESYELVIGFLLKFPEPNSTFNLLKQAAIHLLSKVIFSRDTFDYELGAGLSLLLGRSEVWSRFLNALPTIRHVSRLMFYSRLVLDVGFLLQTPYFVKNTLQVWIRAKWRTQLNMLGCHYDVKRFQEVQEQPGVACNTYQKELLPHLICTSNFNLCCVQHYAKDFHISETELLSCWLKLLLIHLPAVQHKYFSQKYIHQDPSVCEENQSYVFKEETTLTTSYRSSTCLQPTWNLQHSYRQLLYPVLYTLPKEKIEEILEKECLPHISPYDYDTLEFVLNFIKHKPAARAALMVLRHVYSYIRSDVPSEEEMNNWGNELIRPASAIEKEFQKQRLPFHALMQRPWSLLGPLISDSTLNTFLPLYCLKLRRDDFQMQLLWNFIKDVRQTKGNTLAFLRGSRWNFSTMQPKTKTEADYQSFFFSEELFTIQIKLKQLFQDCFAINQDRGIAAGLLILENTNLLPFGQLQVAIAELVAERLTSLAQNNGPETTQYTFSISVEQALPPYLSKELMMTYKRLGCTTPNTLTDRSCVETCSKLSRTLDEALREAGTLRSRWTLVEAGLGLFADLLPECSLLCIHALYFYLAPILLRPSFIGLHNEDQLHVYVSLSQHPFLNDFETRVANHTQEDNAKGRDQHCITDVCCAPDGKKLFTHHHSSKTIHALVDTICHGCHLNSKIARALLLRRLIKAPFWTPLYVISLLERNKNAYKDQDIIAMIGCLPSLETLIKAKEILQKIEKSTLTEGFDTMWFAPFHSIRSTLPGTVERQTKLTFGQSLVEVVSKHRQYLIVHGMESRNFIKLALEIALKNERVLSTTSRTLNLLYSAESTQCIHAVYKESPEKIMDFWRHSLFLDAFDSLGITLQLGNFIKTDKAGLARAFWRQSRQITMTMMQGDEIQQQAYVLLLIVSLSLNFNVKDARLFSRVLAKLLAIVRMCTHRCYQNYETMSKTLQDPSVEFLTHSYGDTIPFRKCLQAVFCTCLSQDHTGNYDKEFVSVLDTFLQAPAVDLLHLLQRMTSTSSTHVLLEYNPFDICPTFQWYYLTPSLLHTSTFLHLHQSADIALKYFHVVHFLNEFLQAIFPPQDQHAVLFGSFSSVRETCKLSSSCQETLVHLEVLLQKFVTLALLDNLLVSSIKHSFSLEFLFCNSIVPNQTNCAVQEQYPLPLSQNLLFTLLQFQVISCLTAYQCFETSVQFIPNQKKHYQDLCNHYFGALPIFLLLLVCMAPSLHTKTKPLTLFFSKIIVKNPKALFQITLFFPLLNDSTRSLYFTLLHNQAESLQLQLPPFFQAFVKTISH
ncbi:uncharacterized protein LOC128883110 [Hylaeus volcanicus]|uniref:uncharacterized protein LOC128883110 n=1 Tax=Hylaeus volcanicus TaxID=313075 RepID=UPI0023B82038|nr:uncharacterized protein LOC128883110 [Hylaeus volcanicus]